MDTQKPASILVGPNMSYGEIEGKDKRSYSVRVNSVVLKVPIGGNPDINVRQKVLVDFKKHTITPLGAETTLIDYPKIRDFLANLDYSGIFELIIFERGALFLGYSNYSIVITRGDGTHLDDLAATYVSSLYPAETSPAITSSNGLVGRYYETALSLRNRYPNIERRHGVIIATFEGLVEPNPSATWNAILKPGMLEYCVEHTRIKA